MSMSQLQRQASEHVDELRPELSEFHQKIWSYAEPAWREYRSAELYVDYLRNEGFEVEAGSAGMPTAFHARWGSGGPEIGMYAEYDATPGYSQEAATVKQPRAGLHPWAPGFTDSHSALGVAALAGAVAAKRALEQNGRDGVVHLFGEPAEKVCGSKAVHANHGYYDTLDAAISYHPFWYNTALWETLPQSYWSVAFTFECTEEVPWVTPFFTSNFVTSQNAVRSPGATDALTLMIGNTRMIRQQMFPATGSWSLNEAILGAANATADNLPARIAQIQYSWRSPLIGVQEQILGILKRTAKQVAETTNCKVSMRWITKTRPGLPNTTITNALYDNFTELGAPEFGPEVDRFMNELERSLGYEATASPSLPETHRLIHPEETEAGIRQNLPAWQACTGTDDYTEYSWYAPTVRFFTARPFLGALGRDLWHWANNSLNGLASAIDPTWVRGGQVIATTAVQLIEDRDLLARCQAEFAERKAQADPAMLVSQLPEAFQAPVELPWPEYVQTARGYEWMLPTTSDFGEEL